MGKNDRSWIPGAVDLDWIESLATDLPRALAAIEAAAEPLNIPIVDRDSGRVLSVLAGGRRRIVEVGTAYGYSTLWMALGQPRDGTIVTIDPDRERTDLARGWWRDAGVADERITVVNAPALDAFGAGEPALAGPFDLAFIDAPKAEYSAYLEHIVQRLAPGALVVADNVLWSGRVSGARPVGSRDRETAALVAFDAEVMRDPRFTTTILPVGDGLLIASWRGAERLVAVHDSGRRPTTMTIHVRVRLFALQRELAGAREVPLDLSEPASVEAAWDALVARHPVLAPGRPSVRFARNGVYADAADPLADGDEVAMIPPVSGGSGARLLELRDGPFDAGILAELADRLADPGDGAVVGFLGRTRATPGTPAPGQEAEAARHVGRRVESLEYEAHEAMALDTLAAIADEIARRFGVTGLAIVHRTGEVPLGQASIAVVAVAPHRDAAFAAARYAIDETKARAPIWKAERFADGHVWIGHPARTGPPERVSGPGDASIDDIGEDG